MSNIQQTSLEAYQDIKRNLGARQQKVYDAIKTLVCPTNLEISGYTRLPINVVTPRTNELVKKGFVKEFERRECTVSGRMAIAWCVAL